jgi:hypothetical protein
MSDGDFARALEQAVGLCVFATFLRSKSLFYCSQGLAGQEIVDDPPIAPAPNAIYFR